MTCPYCEERPSELPNGSCRDCAMDDELNGLIAGAVARASALGIRSEKFMDLVEAAAEMEHR